MVVIHKHCSCSWDRTKVFLHKAISVAKEISSICAIRTGIESECSFEPASKLPVKSLLMTAAETIGVASEAYRQMGFGNLFHLLED